MKNKSPWPPPEKIPSFRDFLFAYSVLLGTMAVGFTGVCLTINWLDMRRKKTEK